MRIAITGANGFLGQPLARFLAGQGHAVAAIAQTPTAAGLFNLGSGEAPPLLETVHCLRDLIDPAAPLGLGGIPDEPNLVLHLETGWRPTTPLVEGLRRTVDWHRMRRASGQ